MRDLENKKNPVVITIARDFGAEGHEICLLYTSRCV